MDRRPYHGSVDILANALTPNARQVLERRYLLRDAAGAPTETPQDLFRRVAHHLAEAEAEWNGQPSKWEELFYEAVASLRFLPNSPTLMNAGRPLGQLAACFVLPIEDSLESIFDTLKLAAKIHQSGGGTGFAFSRLRPRGDTVQTTMGTASGPVSFLEIYDAATERIKQGSFRRGANMGILEVTHPDIMEFIDVKRSGGVTNFNLSVGVTEEWMDSVLAGEDYPLVNPRTGREVTRASAGEVFHRMAESAWESGDPGIVFLDRLNHPRTNPTPQLGSIEATNPCGEQPLLPFEACVLGSVNLAAFLGDEGIDWEGLADTVSLGIRFLDNAVERSRYPIPEIEAAHRLGNRKVGLGVMGWADLLVRLGVPYDSEKALAWAEEVMGFIEREADLASARLADERGPFPNWEISVYGPADLDRPLRNATRTTIAPTGTISIIAGCSSGIEPLFALSFHRRVLDGSTLRGVNPEFERVGRERGFWSEGLAEEVAEVGSCRSIKTIPEDVRRVFGAAHDIAPEWHVLHQAAFQRHVDNAVSKTINLPEDAAVDDIADVFLLAHRLGCKGITVYRDRSKQWQVLNLGRPAGTDLGTVEGSAPAVEEDKPIAPPERGRSLLEVCPVCGQASFEFAEACGKCHICGHSIC